MTQIFRAHMASFPDRFNVLEAAVHSVASQVDEVKLVLNETTEIPSFLAQFENVEIIVAGEDYKDVGKFVTTPPDDALVYFVDDDLAYRDGYFQYLADAAAKIGLDNHVFGLHASIYRALPVTDANNRKSFYYRKPLRQAVYVDQVATNSALALGKNVPPLEYMNGSQKFVDVRYAKWCYENGLSQISLARPINMAKPLRHGGDTIFRSFTIDTPPPVLAEINSFAGKNPKLWQHIGERRGAWPWAK